MAGERIPTMEELHYSIYGTTTNTYTSNQTAPVILSSDYIDKLQRIVSGYTRNDLTLAQAISLIQALVYEEHPDSYTNKGIMRHCLDLLGHRFAPDEYAAIEVGFEGNIQLWLESINFQPKGLHYLFQDNYAQYKGEK